LLHNRLLSCALALFVGITPVVPTAALADAARAETVTASATEDASAALEQQNKLEVIKLPFFQNIGQVADPAVQYYADTYFGRAYVTSQGLTYQFKGESEDTSGWTLEEAFSGTLQAKGIHPTAAKANYFLGNDSRRWQTDVPGYDGVSLGERYPGIEVSLQAHGNNVEKLFTIAPGADPVQISVTVKGATSLSVNGQGELAIDSGKETVAFTAPRAYQQIEGRTEQVPVKYTVQGDRYGFAVGSYNRQYPLVIDPLIAATYLGGSGNDFSYGVAPGPNGDIYVTGYTMSNNFPGNLGVNSTYKASYDMFVARLSGDLTRLIAATYIGGVGADYARKVVYSHGQVFVAGYTNSSDIPHTKGQLTGSASDAYLASLNPDLSKLQAARIWGGNQGEALNNLIVGDLNGEPEAIVVGYSYSTDYPVTVGVVKQAKSSTSNLQSGIVTILDSNFEFIASTYLDGSSGNTLFSAVAIMPNGNFAIGGSSGAIDYPTTPGAYDNENTNTSSTTDGVVTVMNSNLTGILASTYIGQNSTDDSNVQSSTEQVTQVMYREENGVGYLYAAGGSTPYSFPAGDITTRVPNSTSNDAFIIKLRADTASRTALTVFGGSGVEGSDALALDDSGHLFLAGTTTSTNLTVTSGQQGYDQGSYNHGYLAEFDTNLNRLQATYTSLPYKGLALDSKGRLIACGTSAPANPPIGTSRAFQPTSAGGGDTVVAVIDPATLMAAGTDTTAPVWGEGTLIADQPGSDRVTLSWPVAADDSGVDEYLIYRNDVPIDAVPGNQTTYVATGLFPATSYTFKVEAMDLAGNWTALPLTNEPVSTLLSSAPTWPGGSTLAVSYTDTYDHLRLTWPAAVDDGQVVGYKLTQNGINVTDAVYSYSVTDQVYTSDLTGLAGNTAYTFKVQAVDNDGYTSLTGPEATITTQPAPDTSAPYWPAGDSKPSILTTSPTSVLISWPSALDDTGVDHYTVTTYEKAHPEKTRVETAAGDANGIEVTSLANQITYGLSLKAVDAVGNVSTEIRIDDFQIPGVPFGSGTGAGNGAGGNTNLFLIGAYLSSFYPSINSQTGQFADASTFGATLDSAANVPLKPLIKLFFYYNVADRSDNLSGRITLSKAESGQSVPIEVSINTNFDERRYLFVKPLSPLEPLTSYKLSISRQIVAKNKKVLGYDKDLFFTTGAPVAAGEVHLGSGDANARIIVGTGMSELTVAAAEPIVGRITDFVAPDTAVAGTAALDLSPLFRAVDELPAAYSLPQIKLSAPVSGISATDPVEVAIPGGATVTGTTYWSGEFNLPTAVNPIATNTTVQADPGFTAATKAIVEVGAWDQPLTTDRAVRIRFPGMAGYSVGTFRNGQFAKINRWLTADSQAAGDALPAGGDGQITVGDDLIVWTKHFTQFVLYAQTSPTPTDTTNPGAAPTPTPTNTSDPGATPSPSDSSSPPPPSSSGSGGVAPIQASGMLQVDPAWAASELQDPSKPVLTLDVTELAADDNNAKAVNIPAAVVDAVRAAAKPVVLLDSGVKWKLPVSGLPSGQEVLYTLAQPKTDSFSAFPPDTKGRAAYSLTASGDQGKGKLASGKMLAELPIPHGTGDAAKLAVYRLNDSGTGWEYVGGRASGDKLTFQTDRFGTYLVAESTKSFGDIGNHWAKRTIEIMAARQIASGVGNGQFAPNARMTRAEFAVLLTRVLRLGDASAAAASTPFRDVKTDAWYAAGVRQAASAGLIVGDSGCFHPDQPITRQEMAVMIMRAYRLAGGAESSAAAGAFTDGKAVASWAIQAVQVAHELDIVQGRPDGRFGPAADASRAEGLSMLFKLMDKLGL